MQTLFATTAECKAERIATRGTKLVSEMKNWASEGLSKPVCKALHWKNWVVRKNPRARIQCKENV